MAQLNSGDRLQVWDPHEGWVSFITFYLTEATEYRLRYRGHPMDIRIQGMPVPFHIENDYFTCSWTTPFQSGSVMITIGQEEYGTYVYPDDRKMTEEQYDIMLADIMEEASLCFQYSGFDKSFDATGKSREISWSQWTYIERHFFELRRNFNRIVQQPIRNLEKASIMMKRERVQGGQSATMRWLDRKGHGTNIPTFVENAKTSETTNVYENQVLKQHLTDLRRLLKKYEKEATDGIASRAKRMVSIVSSWMNGPFLIGIDANSGPYQITQRFRKNPKYRKWYRWFEELYNHKNEGIGFSHPIPLKDTYQLYEIWCFMMIVKALREKGLIQDTSDMYKTTRSGVFLDLKENKESRIKLTNEKSLYFQRTYQYNTKVFHTYTQRMIPDIVLEGEDSIVIFDPKYRVESNLGTALGEMHKYKDGILHRITGKRAVEQVYILTPTKTDSVESLRYFWDDFHEKYRMGAIRMVPDSNNKYLDLSFIL